MCEGATLSMLGMSGELGDGVNDEYWLTACWKEM